eukprot:403348777
MRYSSNTYESEPGFIKELLKYNDIYHQEFNPSLLTKTAKKVYDEVLGLQIPPDQFEFDRRYMVKPPYKQDSKRNNKVTENLNNSQNNQAIYKSQKNQIKASKLYERFVSEYESGVREELSFGKHQELQGKIRRVFDSYDKKVNGRNFLSQSFTTDRDRGQSQLEISPQRLIERKMQIKQQLLANATVKIMFSDYEQMLLDRQNGGKGMNNKKMKQQVSIDGQIIDQLEDIDIPEQLNQQTQQDLNLQMDVQNKIMLGELLKDPHKMVVESTPQNIHDTSVVNGFDNNRIDMFKSQDSLQKEQQLKKQKQLQKIQLEKVRSSFKKKNQRTLNKSVNFKESSSKMEQNFQNTSKISKYTNESDNQNNLSTQVDTQQLSLSFQHSINQTSLISNLKLPSLNRKLSFTKQSRDRQLLEELQKRQFDNKRSEIQSILQDCQQNSQKEDSIRDIEKLHSMRKLTKQNFTMIQALRYMEEIEEDRLYYKDLLKQNKVFDDTLNVTELIKHRNFEKECNTENFFTEKVLKKFKEDNIQTSRFIKLLWKDTIWKPDKFVPSRVAELNDAFAIKKQ